MIAMHMRATAHSGVQLTPFEILHGRPMRVNSPVEED